MQARDTWYQSNVFIIDCRKCSFIKFQRCTRITSFRKHRIDTNWYHFRWNEMLMGVDTNKNHVKLRLLWTWSPLYKYLTLFHAGPFFQWCHARFIRNFRKLSMFFFSMFGMSFDQAMVPYELEYVIWIWVPKLNIYIATALLYYRHHKLNSTQLAMNVFKRCTTIHTQQQLSGCII